MQFLNERQLNVPCANTLCQYQGDSRFEACCDSELKNGDPAHSTCKLYFPIEQPPAELVEARHIPQHRQAEISARWYTCSVCGNKFQFNIDGCPKCGGSAETIGCA
jgi:rubrerythrin